MKLNTFTQKITRIVIELLFFAGIIVVATIPWWADYAYTYMIIGDGMYVILYIAGICSLFILWQIRSFYKTFQQGNPFEQENVTRLRSCSIACFLISLVFAVKIFFIYTDASFLLVILFGVLGLACLTIKDLFKQAIIYKEETDWTV